MKAITHVHTLKDYIKCLEDKVHALEIGILTAEARSWSSEQVIQSGAERLALSTVANDLQLLLDKPLRATYWKRVN